MKNKAFDHSKYQDWIDPNKVKPYERNAKEHTETQIKNIATSIRKFGWQQDTVITTDNVCVIGHGRRLAAIQLGCEMPFHYVNKTADELTDEDIRELRIIDNETNAETGFDYEVLKEEIEDLNFDEFDINFSADVLNGGGGTEYDIAEDDPPEPQETVIAKKGNLWKLGRHRLMCGDSISREDVELLMDGKKADLLLTDPPYNVNLGSNIKPHSDHNDSILNDNMEEKNFIAFLSSAFESANAVMENGAAWYIFYAGLNHTSFDLAIRNIKEWKTHEQLVWVKSNHALGRNCDYQWKHEPLLYGWKTGKDHYFTDSRAETTVIEDVNTKLVNLKKSELIELCEKLLERYESTTVLYAEKANSAELHPSIKPQGLLAPLILNSSKKGWNVLDLFGGSGTTLMACEQTGRKCYMMELDPHYCDVIIKRWETFTGEKAVLING